MALLFPTIKVTSADESGWPIEQDFNFNFRYSVSCVVLCVYLCDLVFALINSSEIIEIKCRLFYSNQILTREGEIGCQDRASSSWLLCNCGSSGCSLAGRHQSWSWRAWSWRAYVPITSLSGGENSCRSRWMSWDEQASQWQHRQWLLSLLPLLSVRHAHATRRWHQMPQSAARWPASSPDARANRLLWPK